MITFYRNARKFNNVPQTYNGYSYDSKKEAQKAWDLDMLVKAGEIRSWKRQEKIELFGQNGSRICNYHPDFTVEHNDGTIEYIEIKSPATMTPTWRLKWKLFEDKLGKDCRYKLTIEK